MSKDTKSEIFKTYYIPTDELNAINYKGERVNFLKSCCHEVYDEIENLLLKATEM